MLGIAGAVLVVALGAEENLPFRVVLWLLPVLLAGLGLYSSWALLSAECESK
jgi:hypothetical protein